MAVDTTTATPSGIDVYPPIVASGGGGGGTVTSVTAGDETIIIGGTATDPTVRANTTDIVTAGEALTSGMLVNVYDNAGTPTARKADCSLGQAYRCDGFVVDTVAMGVSVKVYYIGRNSHCTGLVSGDVWLGTAGLPTQTPPTTTGYISQKVGTASSATELEFNPSEDVLIAATHAVTTGGSSQSTVITSTQNITINNAVGAGFLTMVGGGAGGKSTANAAAAGGGGGGAAEYCQNFMIPLTPGETVTVTIGAGGTAGVDGGTTSFACAAGTFSVLGGKAAPSGTGGAGGGPRGAVGGTSSNPGNIGNLGSAESPVHYGGSSGAGSGNGASTNGGAGGGGPGNLVGGAGGAGNTHGGGGGGGGATPWGVGGAGGAGNAGGSNAPAGAYGAGGGGAGGNDATGQTGGTGANGYVLLMYVA